MAKQEQMIQIGDTAMRDPVSGEFENATPLYENANSVLRTHANLFCFQAGMLKKYLDEMRTAGVEAGA